MGLFKRYSNCSHGSTPAPAPLPNPNPSNFRIVQSYEDGNYTVVQVNYPDCTNYEGNKIMVYRERSWTIHIQKTLDPHFCEECFSPIARFEPTLRGWDMAVKLVKSLR